MQPDGSLKADFVHLTAKTPLHDYESSYYEVLMLLNIQSLPLQNMYSEIKKQSIADLTSQAMIDLIDDIIPNIEDYFVPKYFRHNQHDFRNLSQWIMQVPHGGISGKCLTFDPKYRSNAGSTNGAIMLLKKPQKPFPDFYIYIHEKGQFGYFETAGASMPNVFKMEWSKIKFGHRQ